MVVILLDFLIWWDHPHPSNHFIFSYISMDFSWKNLSKVKGASVCVCWNKGPPKGNLQHQGNPIVSSTFT
jgi:hypothetical protein